jgi:micrococcal nuclease
VVQVLDGMTIEVTMDGQTFIVRYLGVDIPPATAQEALAFNRFLVEGRTVELERDMVGTDPQGRLLRYVYVNGEMVNQALLTNGYAVVAPSSEEFAYQAEFLVAQESAKTTERGVWEPSRQANESHEAVTPTATPAQSEDVQEFSGGTLPRPRGDTAVACDYSGTKEAVIKGNVDLLTGERTYHVPGSFFYDTIVVDEREGDAWLCTELEAVAQGWKRSKR